MSQQNPLLDGLQSHVEPPPHSIDAEQATLGAALISRNAVERVLEMLERDDFYLEAHRKIFDVISYLSERDSPIDTLSVTEVLRKREQLERIGGIAYILTLNNSVPTAAHVEYYAQTVAEKALRRRLIHAASEIAGLGYDNDSETATLLGRAEERILGVERRSRSSVQVFTSAELWADQYNAYVPGLIAEPSISTGFPTLDNFLNGGFAPGEMSLLAARPSMGKTAVSVEMSVAAIAAGIPTAFVSLEISRRKLLARYLSVYSAVPLSSIIRQSTTPDQWIQIVRAGEQLAERPLTLVDDSQPTLSDLCAVLRRLVRERGVQLIFIDQLQCIQRDTRAENENVGYTRIVYGLAQFAKQHHVHICLNCQLNRSNERREEKRPMLSDLRDSGSLEQSARVVIAVHRPDYYLRHQRGTRDAGQGVLELGVLKNTDGEVGWIPLWSNLAVCRVWEGPPNPEDNHS